MLVTELHRLLVRNMKRYRTLLGITQAELAERAGISVGYVGEVEMGRKFPSPGKFEGIARALELRPFRLLMGPEDVTDAMGPDAVYETAEKLKARSRTRSTNSSRKSTRKTNLFSYVYYQNGKRLRGR